MIYQRKIVIDDDYRKSWRKKCSIDKSKIEQESLNNTDYRVQLLEDLRNCMIDFENIKKEKNKLYKERKDYYKNDFEDVLSDAEVKLHLETDDSMVELNDAFNCVESDVEYIKHMIEITKARAWDIKAYINWKNFTEGN